MILFSSLLQAQYEQPKNRTHKIGGHVNVLMPSKCASAQRRRVGELVGNIGSAKAKTLHYIKEAKCWSYSKGTGWLLHLCCWHATQCRKTRKITEGTQITVPSGMIESLQITVMPSLMM